MQQSDEVAAASLLASSLYLKPRLQSRVVSTRRARRTGLLRQSLSLRSEVRPSRRERNDEPNKPWWLAPSKEVGGRHNGKIALASATARLELGHNEVAMPIVIDVSVASACSSSPSARSRCRRWPGHQQLTVRAPSGQAVAVQPLGRAMVGCAHFET